jgi:hypothetical protein
MSSEPIDIEDMRKRHANSIRNTATGRALGEALDELEKLREQYDEEDALPQRTPGNESRFE